MLDERKDTIGRDTFYTDREDYSIVPTKRAMEWFHYLNLHGLLNTDALYEFTKEMGVDRKKAAASLKRMRDGAFIGLNEAQRMTDRAMYNRYVYHLRERGQYELEKYGYYEEDAIQPSGNDWRHQYGIASVTSAIHLGAKKAGVEYIPGHELLKDAEASLAYEGLIPDQLFALDYGGKWRIYAVEFDRSYDYNDHETKKARRQYKSGQKFAEKIAKYTKYIGEGKYKDHLNVDTGMQVLFVFDCVGGQMKFLRELEKQHQRNTYILMQTVDGFVPKFKPMPPYYHLFDGPWERLGCEDFFINQP